MQLSELLSHLTQSPEPDLIFEFQHGPIRKDYHLTEVLRVQVDAIDCGGAVDHWSETVLQLVEPRAENGLSYMSAGKALAILKGSLDRIALDTTSEVLLEYKSVDSSAAQRFHIGSIQMAKGQMRVMLLGTDTQCKAAERSQAANWAKTQASACCSPGANEAAPRSATSAPGTARCCA